MQQTITPDKQTVEACLKNKSYYIDFYQREYVWTKETVEVLLRDIFYSFEISYDQFKDAELSQEVLEKFNWYYLNIYITNNIGGKIYVVDGQQRLTTLSLLTRLLGITENPVLTYESRPEVELFFKEFYAFFIFAVKNTQRIFFKPIAAVCA